jgi:murein DD-endopeptidase MepM/ murein hydrolase activator NlpD
MPPVTSRMQIRSRGGQSQGHDCVRAVTMRAMLEGHRVSRISVRGIAVASATAVTTVGAVVGVSSGSEPTAAASQPVEAADATLLYAVATGQQANEQAASFTEQAQTQLAEAQAAAQRAAAEAARKKAAADAAAKKAAAEAKKKADDEAQSLLQTVDYSITGIQSIAQQIVGSTIQYGCFSWIVERESGWNYRADNPSTHAYGLVQALPGYKMASAGADWRTNPATQIKWGLNYMNHTYGSPCKAKKFWELNGWY